MISHSRTRSSLLLYILNFGYFRSFFYFEFRYHLYYIHLFFSSLLGTIQRMVPRALLGASHSSHTNFFSVYVYTSLTVLEKTVINKTYKVILLVVMEYWQFHDQ